MAWSTITSFSSGDSNIAAKLNQFRDNLNSLRRFNDAGVVLSLDDDMNVADSTLTPIVWDVVQDQEGATVWTVAQPTRLVAPVTGKYAVILNAEWRTSASGERTIAVIHSGALGRVDLESQGALLGGGNESGMDILLMTAGDYLVCSAYQSSGGTIGIKGGGRDRSTVAFWLLGT